MCHINLKVYVGMKKRPHYVTQIPDRWYTQTLCSLPRVCGHRNVPASHRRCTRKDTERRGVASQALTPLITQTHIRLNYTRDGFHLGDTRRVSNLGTDARTAGHLESRGVLLLH
ncbi:hypothetical protein DPEC_G00115600 [Dallia pectoralis]|uniref:Uncharacterized protein n=1 Tax=Dallia pectoralis TaxID=75939 RepID=A0ACC2GUX7_DALPE|nr:hypothetical protein DPEC_G00115600 [Dallia pectoralis]